jgi:hypothetical protein
VVGASDGAITVTNLDGPATVVAAGRTFTGRGGLTVRAAGGSGAGATAQ